MAEELKQEQEVLLVSNEGSDQLEVVSKVDENGALKTIAPKQANEADFLKFDKHSNMLENFLKNYFAQAKNPKHTGMYRVAADGIENIAGVIKGLLENGGDEGKEYLSKHQVDASEFKQEKQNGYKAMDLSQVDWDAFSKIGVSKESLEKSGALEDMLNYRRSSELHPITIKVDDLTLNTDARLSLKRGENGKLIPVVHAVRSAPQLDRPFYGINFTPEDKANLRKTGHLGRKIEIINKKTGEVIPSFVSIDSKTNELIAYNAKNVRIPQQIKGVTLTEQQRTELLEGKGVYIEGMTSKNGKSFNATVQVNASERGLTFSFEEGQKQAKQMSQEKKDVRIPDKIGGVEISEQNKDTLKKGDVIYVEGMKDKKGENYNAYIKVNKEQGKLDFYKWDPRKQHKVTPDNNSKTQVAVNSEGKTNEQTKHNTEALKQGQESPNSDQQQRQNKPKMKM